MAANNLRTPLATPRFAKWGLIGLALAFLGLVLVLPLAAVFVVAFRLGFLAFYDAVAEPDAWMEMKLTFLVAAIAVPLKLVFGVAASLAIQTFTFRGQSRMDRPRVGKMCVS